MLKAAVQFLLKTVWALDEATFQNMKAVSLSLNEKAVEPKALSGPGNGSESRGYEILNGVALVPIKGVITRNDYWWWPSCNVDALACAINRAANDAGVRKIVLDIDSPGGETDGGAEAADAIFAARSKKQVVAYARGQMCSMAYWLGSQANEIYAGKASAVGNIGVYTTLIDSSKAAEEAGMKVHLVKAGALKGAGEPGVPITPDQLKEVQNFVDSLYGLFVDAVAQGRGLKSAQVKAFADGRTVLGEEAVELGLIDGVEPFEVTLARVTESAKALAAQGKTKKAPAHAGGYTEAHDMSKMTCPNCKSEFEIEEDEEKKKKDDEEKAKAEIAAKASAAVTAAPQKSADELRQEGILAERAYRGEFNTTMDVAGIKGEARARFEKKFYGRGIDDVKFMAEEFLGAATPAAGDGPGAAVALPEASEPKGKAKTTQAEAVALWNDATIRRAFGYSGSADPASEEFKKGLERYCRAATA